MRISDWSFSLVLFRSGITIPTDPVNDTDDVMGDHSPADGPDPTSWTFLATVPDWPADATRRLAYGHTFSKTGEGYQVHGVVSHVVDKQGRWCARPLHRRRHHDCQPRSAERRVGNECVSKCRSRCSQYL